MGKLPRTGPVRRHVVMEIAALDKCISGLVVGFLLFSC